MVVFSKPEQLRQVADLREAFKESDLPFRVDLFVWDDVPANFRSVIEEDHVVLTKVDCTHKPAKHIKHILADCIEMNEAAHSPKEKWSFINYLDTGNITENLIADIQHLIIGQDKIPSRARKKAQSGDIVYSLVRPIQKHYGLLKKIPKHFLVSTGFSVFRGKPNFADTGFIYYYLTQNHVVDHLQTIAEHNTSAYPSIRPSDIQKLQINLPPLPTQQAIAHILGTLDDKIELNRRMNETLEAMAQTIFKDWFVDFGPVRAKMEGREPYLSPELWELFPDTLDNEGKPVGWINRPLKDFLELLYGKSLPAKKRVAGNFSVYGSGGKIGTHDTPLIDGPTIIVGRKGTVGSLFWENDAIYPIDTVFYVIPLIGSMLFIYHLLATQPLKNMNTDAAVPGLNRKNVYRLEFPEPNSELLQVFERIVSMLWIFRAKNLNEVDLLFQVHSLLLPKLISGKIRMKDVENIIQEVI